MNQAFIAVGSNIQPGQSIRVALDHLQRHVSITGISTFYRTMALPGPRQPDPQPAYFNGVVQVETSLKARELKFDVLRAVENTLGRERGDDKFAPRTIDLDLIVYDEDVVNTADLRLPDPDIRTRNFIAVPLLELAPQLVLPDSGEKLASLPVARARGGLEPLPELTADLREMLQARVVVSSPPAIPPNQTAPE